MEEMTDSERRFAERAMRRRHVFISLAVAGVVIGALLAAFYGYRRWQDPGFPLGLRAVIVILILLNARQNLRQYRYAVILGKAAGVVSPPARV